MQRVHWAALTVSMLLCAMGCEPAGKFTEVRVADLRGAAYTREVVRGVRVAGEFKLAQHDAETGRRRILTLHPDEHLALERVEISYETLRDQILSNLNVIIEADGKMRHGAYGILPPGW